MTSARRRSLIIVVLILALLLGGAASMMLPVVDESTNNAYVRSDFTLVAPRVAGHVEAVLVEDNQWVEPGQLLVRLDPNDFQARVNAAEGDLVSARGELNRIEAAQSVQQSRIRAAEARVAAAAAELAFARQELERHENLSRRGAGSRQLAQQAQAQIVAARSAHTRAEADRDAEGEQLKVLAAQLQEALGRIKLKSGELEEAQLALSYTEVKAPVRGMVGRRSVRVGAHVGVGEPLLAVVPLQDAYVLANFQENQLTAVEPGQPVSIAVDTFPDIALTGYVDSLAPASGVTFAPIAPDNATGNFTKIVQRIPVKIRFDPDQPRLRDLRVGMSVIATIRTADRSVRAGVGAEQALAGAAHE